MDVDLREALSTGFGLEPPHPPVAERIAAGRRAVRRRQLAGSVVAVAMAAILGIAAAVVLSSDGSAPSHIASDTGGKTESPELARYDEQGNLQLHPGVTVVDRVDEPYPPSAGKDHSVALALEYQGQESWLLLTWAQDRDGGQSASGAGMSEVPADGSFRAWVDEQVRLAVTPKPEDDSAGYLDFADDGSLVASHGVEILEQAHPIRLKDFTLGDEPTGAALLQGPDGKKWYVVVRDVDGVEVIAVPFKTGGPNLAAFLDYAREKYASGEGLR